MLSRGRLRKTVNSLFRRLTALTVVLAYLAAMIGFPMPASARKISSEPFPCQNHSCGCMNAEQCRHSCCCFTAQQRRDWAVANQVEPAEVDGGWNDRPQGQKSEAKKDCCGGSCMVVHKPTVAQPADAACEEKACCHEDGLNDEDDSISSGSVRWVLGLDQQKCRGQQNLWIASGAVLPPPESVVVSFDQLLSDWVRPIANRANSVVTFLLDPPPRSSL